MSSPEPFSSPLRPTTKSLTARGVIVVILLPLLTICLQAVAAAQTPSPDPEARRQLVARILTDSQLWGKDLPAALASLPAWRDAGDDKVIIFSNRVVAARGFRSRGEAEDAFAKLNSALRQSRLAPRPEVLRLLGEFSAQPSVTLQPRVQPQFEDGLAHVALTGQTTPQILQPNLSLETVRRRIGEPERITRIVIDPMTERRSVTLTLYSYAGGAVVFAESDIAPRPGLINRVIISTPEALSALFQEVIP